MPAVDVAETDKAYEITAELPGMEEKNVEVRLANGILSIKGVEAGREGGKGQKLLPAGAQLRVIRAQLSSP